MKNLFYLIGIVCIVSCSASKKNQVKETPDVRVKITTGDGAMVIKLYNETPRHRDNFVSLVKKHFYDSLLFHRVEKEFIIQAGDPASKYAKTGQKLGEESLNYTVPAEYGTDLFHKKGAVASAKEVNNNSEKRSNSTQFYIVEGKTFTDGEMDRMEEKLHIKIPESHRQVYRTIGGLPFLDMNNSVFGEVVSGLDVLGKIASVPTDANERPLKNIRMKITLMK